LPLLLLSWQLRLISKAFHPRILIDHYGRHLITLEAHGPAPFPEIPVPRDVEVSARETVDSLFIKHRGHPSLGNIYHRLSALSTCSAIPFPITQVAPPLPAVSSHVFCSPLLEEQRRPVYRWALKCVLKWCNNNRNLIY